MKKKRKKWHSFESIFVHEKLYNIHHIHSYFRNVMRIHYNMLFKDIMETSFMDKKIILYMDHVMVTYDHFFND